MGFQNIQWFFTGMDCFFQSKREFLKAFFEAVFNTSNGGGRHIFGDKNMGTRSVSVAYTLQPDPPIWTLLEQGISRGWEPIHKDQALLG